MAKVKPGEVVEINGTIYKAGDELPKPEIQKQPINKEKKHGSSVSK